MLAGLNLLLILMEPSSEVIKIRRLYNKKIQDKELG
jgi:hypothetical protein